MTLRARFAVAALAVVVLLVATSVVLPTTLRDSQVDQVDRQLLASVPIASVVAERASNPDDRPGPGPEPGSVRDALSEVYLATLDDDGGREVVAQSPATGDREPVVPSGEPGSVREPPTPVTVGSLDGHGSWRAVVVETFTGEHVLLAIPLDRVEATARRMVLATGLCGLTIAVVLGLLGWWLLRLGLRPIAQVTEVARAIAAGERFRRVAEPKGRTEAALLARAFNVMLDDQAEIEARLRQFVADASHELRTPVAAIGGFADLWREGALDEAQLEDVMRRIGQESARMRALVEDLLLLARLDEGVRLHDEAVDLVAIAADAVLDASATHPSRPVSLDASGELVVRGDEARLRQVTSNLVANALLHAGGTATVTISVAEDDGDAVLRVVDDGPGMDPDAAVHAFDRFWRGDPSRARSGSGLGLSIVQGIAHAHGGDVTLDTARGAGVTVTVRLPIDRQETRNSSRGSSQVGLLHSSP